MTITPIPQNEIARNRYRPGCRLRLWPEKKEWRTEDLFFEIKLAEGEQWTFDLQKSLNFDPDYRSSYPRGVNDVWLLDDSRLRVNIILSQIKPDETRAWLESWLSDLVVDNPDQKQ